MSKAVIVAARTTQAGLNFCLLTYNCCMYNKTQNVLIHNETGLPIGVIWGNISAVSKIFFLCLWSRIPICSKSCSSMMLVPCNIQSSLEYELVSQFILPPGQLAPRGASCPGISYPPPWLSSPPGASCPGRFILPPAHTEKNFLCDVYYYLQHFNNYMQFLSYKYVNLRWLLQTFSWVSLDKEWGASCPGRFILPPAQNFKENG